MTRRRDICFIFILFGFALALLLPTSSFLHAESASSISPLSQPEGPQVTIRALELEGNTLISSEELLEVMARHLPLPIPPGGTVVSLRALREMLEALLNFHLEEGYSGIAIYIPPESIEKMDPLTFKQDVLKVKIVEGRVTDVMVQYRVQGKWRPWKWGQPGYLPEGRRHSLGHVENWIRRSVPVKQTYLRREELESIVDLLERHPGRSAAAVIKTPEQSDKASTEVGNEVAVELRVVDSDPLTVYTQFSNTGSQTTEELRVRLGLLHNNLFGRDDILTLDLQAAADDNLDDNYATFLSYDAPLWDPRWRARVFGAYSEFKSTDILGPGSSFLGDGYVLGQEISATVWQSHGWFLDFFEAIDFQNSEVDSPFGFSTELDLFDVGGGIRLERSRGNWRTSLEFKGSYNLSGSFDLSDENDFAGSRLGAEPGYHLFTLRGYQSWQIGQWFSFNQQMSALYAGERLVSARQLSIGGLNTVRGYEEFEVLGDRGFYLATEPRIRANALISVAESFPLQVEIVPAFLDVGWVEIHKPVGGEEESSTLLATGTGMRFFLRDFFFARFYLGFALRDAQDSGDATQSGDSRFHFELTLRF